MQFSILPMKIWLFDETPYLFNKQYSLFDKRDLKIGAINRK